MHVGKKSKYTKHEKACTYVARYVREQKNSLEGKKKKNVLFGIDG